MKMKLPKLTARQRRDLTESAALTSIALGLLWIYPPLCLIIVGAMVLAASVLGGRPRK